MTNSHNTVKKSLVAKSTVINEVPGTSRRVSEIGDTTCKIVPAQLGTDQLLAEAEQPGYNAGEITSYEIGAIKISDIIISESLSPRLYFDVKVAQEYAKAMLSKNGKPFPMPILVRDDEGKLHCADGRLRIRAHQLNKKTEIIAQITPGDKHTAYHIGLSANSSHGVRLNPLDRMTNLKRVLANDEWFNWSDRAIGRLCGVDHKTVKTHKDFIRNARSSVQDNSTSTSEPIVPEGANRAYEIFKEMITRTNRFAIKSKTGPGYHRIVYGDSTKPKVLESLFGSNKADLYYTDPPYNAEISSDPDTQRKKPKWFIANNKLKHKGFETLLTDAFKAAKPFLKPGSPIYIWAAFQVQDLKTRLIRQILGHVSQPLIWCKNYYVRHDSYDHTWGHETCLYGWVRGAKRKWFGTSSTTTVIRDIRDSQGIGPDGVLIGDLNAKSGSHPCPKPVEIIIPMIRNSTRPRDTIYDGFLGSGSTVFAAEYAITLCYGIESVPQYVAVILERAQELGLEIIEIPNDASIDDFIESLPKDKGIDMGLAP